MTLRSASGLPMPGQGRCVKCGHYALVHGTDRCHHLGEHEWDADGKCRSCEAYEKDDPAPGTGHCCGCDGFEPAPFVECKICHALVQCKVMPDLTMYRPFGWDFSDDSLVGLCVGCKP